MAHNIQDRIELAFKSEWLHLNIFGSDNTTIKWHFLPPLYFSNFDNDWWGCCLPPRKGFTWVVLDKWTWCISLAPRLRYRVWGFQQWSLWVGSLGFPLHHCIIGSGLATQQDFMNSEVLTSKLDLHRLWH